MVLTLVLAANSVVLTLMPSLCDPITFLALLGHHSILELPPGGKPHAGVIKNCIWLLSHLLGYAGPRHG